MLSTHYGRIYTPVPKTPVDIVISLHIFDQDLDRLPSITGLDSSIIVLIKPSSNFLYLASFVIPSFVMTSQRTFKFPQAILKNIGLIILSCCIAS